MISTYRVINLIQNERLKGLVAMGKDRTYHYLTMGLKKKKKKDYQKLSRL